MSNPNQPSKNATAKPKSAQGPNSSSSGRSNNDSAADSSNGAKYRTIKDSPYKGTISKQDARSAAKLVKNQRSPSK